MRLARFIFLHFAIWTLIGLTLPSVAFSQTWTGSVSSDWNTPGNWDTGTVPTSTSTVVITNMPNKPMINTSVTIASLQIGSWYPGSGTTSLTVISGGSLTITDELTFISDGSLHIDGGTVNHTGTTFSQGGTNRYIEMTSGSFTTNANITVNAGNNTTLPGFSVGSGTATFNGNLTVSNSGGGKIYDGGTGSTVVAGNLTVQGGSGIFNLNEGTLSVAGTVTIAGSFYGGTGEATFMDNITVSSGGYLHVEDATVNITGNATFSNNGNLTMDEGTINVGGNASISNGGSMDLNQGNLNVEGDASFTSGSTVNAGGADITFSGDVTVSGSSNFQSDSSTVIFNGDGEQTINVGSGGTGNITFHDVVIDSGATVTTDGGSENTIIIEGDLTIEEDGSVEVEGNDQIDIQGEIDGEGSDNVTSPAPYAVTAIATNSTTVVITFNKAMEETAAETISNYSIARVDNPASTLTVSAAVLNTGGDSTQVTLTVSTITDDVEYEITMNPSGTMESTDGGELSVNHIKRFTKIGPIIFYSITSGNWASNSTWSRTSHAGSPATSNPSTTSNATIIIGDGDVVTIASTVSITNQTSVEVSTGSKLVVGPGGTLTTGTKTITGDGTFEVSSGHLKIGSHLGISASGSTGNIQTATRTFSSSGSYTYNGSSAQITGTGLPSTVANLTIDNTAGVTLDADLTVSGTLSLTAGSLIIESGNNLIANTKSIGSGDLVMRHVITGSNGWRLLSSPIDSDYDDFLDGIVTQGYPGAYYSTGSNPGDTLQPNVLYYDESYPGTDNQRWRAPDNASTSLTKGRGLFTYIFGDIDADPNYNDILPFPVTLEVQGQEFEGPVDFNVTYTTAADSGWNLVGNPYAATIDWDDSGNWTKTNIDGTIYIWDYDQNQFLTWNGSTGDLGNGLIAPFQGFWIKANDEDPVLIVDEDAKTTGGSFVGKVSSPSASEVPTFSIAAIYDDMMASTHFMFSEDASNAKDPKDAYRLLPFSGIDNYINLSSITSDGEQLAINNLPRDFGIPIEIPIEVELYEQGVSNTGNLYFKFQNFNNIPDGWTITLLDQDTGNEIDILHQPTYIFTHTATKGKLAVNSNLSSKPKLQSKVNPSSTRFIIRISPGEDAEDLPKEYALSQNYPNPFNPSTKINFSLPLRSHVTLAIYDILGRHIATLVDTEMNAGIHTLQWNAQQNASGVYILRMVTEQGVFTKKMMLIK